MNTNITIQGWLNQLVPLQQISHVVGQVLPAFVIVGVFILAIGYMMMLASSETVLTPSYRLIALFAAIAAAPWFLTIGQTIANALVGAIASADPAISWLVVNNPGNASLVMDFSKPFQVIGQFVGGTFANTSGIQWWEVGKWADYIIRGIVIAIVGGVAVITVFIMEVMLILQKLILLGSQPLMPIFIACLSIGAAEGSAQNFLKSVLGVMCWPVGWAIGHIGTMAAIQNLQPPSWTAPLFQLVGFWIGSGSRLPVDGRCNDRSTDAYRKSSDQWDQLRSPSNGRICQCRRPACSAWRPVWGRSNGGIGRRSRGWTSRSRHRRCLGWEHRESIGDADNICNRKRRGC